MEYTRLPGIPNLLSQYGKAALGSVPVVGGSRDATSLPAKGVEVAGVKVDVANLAAYTGVCGLRLGDALPLTYPFTLAFPLTMQLMLDPGYPVAAMGSVHLRNVITSHRALRVGDELSIRARAENLREHPAGLLVDIVTEIRTGDVGDGNSDDDDDNPATQPAWVQRSTMLSKRRTSLSPAKDAPRPERPAPPTAAELGDPTVVMSVDEAQIAEYAAVSGDRNPIHVSGVGAKAFGFPGVIAHGMWTAAALLGTVEGGIPERARYTVEFGKPVVLPAKLAVYARRGVDAGDPAWTITARNPAKLGAVHATATIEAL
ncbi:MaoC family dehydratase [Dietzia sp. UBA5065]|uniref:MaoC family dehydratase n=1 Tax=Dietzia sp. UBA5065 TaxID=1946422 RepID=UPI0025C38C95|nr:MaoC/PaaZ C-terminal domain-containing protein [Dietzia sp. UBA5065]